MGTVYSRYLAGGYTVADFKAAMLSLATELYGGAPTYYNVLATSPYGYQYMEWPDFGGLKVFWMRPSVSATAMTLGIASSAYFNPSTGDRIYRGSATSANFTLEPADKTLPAYLVGVSGEGYRLLIAQHSTATYVTRLLAEMRNPSPVWGSSNRVYHTSDRINVRFAPGRNPWGTLNAEGNVTTTGEDSATVVTTQANAFNTIRQAYEIGINQLINNDQAVIGMPPADICRAAYYSTPDTMTMLDAGNDGLFLRLPGSTAAAGWSVKVDAAPFSGMTTLPAYVVDLANPQGITDPEECVEVWPAYGQCFPNHRALNLTGGGETP